MEVAHTEMEEGERRAAELWAESVTKYNAKRREETLWERLRYHEGQLQRHTRTFEDLLEQHRRGVAWCERALGIETERKETA